MKRLLGTAAFKRLPSAALLRRLWRIKAKHER
jgi:hypothetical protein